MTQTHLTKALSFKEHHSATTYYGNVDVKKILGNIQTKVHLKHPPFKNQSQNIICYNVPYK